MDDSTAPYGGRLYEALKRSGGGALVTGRMNYAAIQALKAADREATLELFRGSEYAVLQRLKADSPEAFATYLVGRAQTAQQTAGAIAAVCCIANLAVILR